MNLEIALPITFYLGIILIFLLCKSRIEQNCYIVFVSFVFVGMAFINILGNSIGVYHVCSLILFLKFFLDRVKKKESFFRKKEKINSLYFFLVYCFFSIFVICFREEILVYGVDPGKQIAHFSFQQFTQYMYLFHAFVMMHVFYKLLLSKTISIDKLWECIDIMYLLAVCIGFIQLFIPVKLFNFLFKNDSIGSVNQSISIMGNKIVRIDSTFPEPSMLTLFLAPIMGVYIYEIIQKQEIKKIIFVVMGVGIELLNQASSFIIGMAAAVIGILGIQILKYVKYGAVIKISKKKLIINFAGLFFILFIFKNLLVKDITLFLNKLTIRHDSGIIRFRTMQLALQAFKNNPILGIGFGTMRSMDLFSSWLGQIGIMGLVLYFVPVGFLSIRLLRQYKVECNKLFLLIFAYNMIMFTTVPEFRFLFIWVYYAMAFYEIEKNKKTDAVIIKEV